MKNKNMDINNNSPFNVGNGCLTIKTFPLMQLLISKIAIFRKCACYFSIQTGILCARVYILTCKLSMQV